MIAIRASHRQIHRISRTCAVAVCASSWVTRGKQVSSASQRGLWLRFPNPNPGNSCPLAALFSVYHLFALATPLPLWLGLVHAPTRPVHTAIDFDRRKPPSDQLCLWASSIRRADRSRSFPREGGSDYRWTATGLVSNKESWREDWERASFVLHCEGLRVAGNEPCHTHASVVTLLGEGQGDRGLKLASLRQPDRSRQ